MDRLSPHGVLSSDHCRASPGERLSRITWRATVAHHPSEDRAVCADVAELTSLRSRRGLPAAQPPRLTACGRTPSARRPRPQPGRTHQLTGSTTDANSSVWLPSAAQIVHGSPAASMAPTASHAMAQAPPLTRPTSRARWQLRRARGNCADRSTCRCPVTQVAACQSVKRSRTAEHESHGIRLRMDAQRISMVAARI